MKNKKQQLVSIIMPCYNAEDFLHYAVESIRMQTYENWELICIDDCSTDRTNSILKKHQDTDKRIKIYTNNVRKGIGASLNLGLKHAAGQFIARMDADDISLPNRISRQVEFLVENKRIVACGGQVAMINNKNQIFAYKNFPTDSQVLYEMIMKLIPMQHPTIMVPSKIIKNYKYDIKLDVAEDVDMIFYLLSKGKISNLKDVVYQYRKLDQSNSNKNIKKTFYITFLGRIKAIKDYGYKPSLGGIAISIFELIMVTFLPSKVLLDIFESVRLYPPFFSKVREIFTITSPTIATSGRNPI